MGCGLGSFLADRRVACLRSLKASRIVTINRTTTLHSTEWRRWHTSHMRVHNSASPSARLHVDPLHSATKNIAHS